MSVNETQIKSSQIKDLASGSAVTSFLELTDSPSSYSGETGKSVVVNAGEDGLEFTTISGSGGTDENAIHDNVVGEINAIAAKTTPVDADIIVIEDSAASFAKKKVTVSNLIATVSGSGATNFLALDDTPSSYSGQAGKSAVVNQSENALEFTTVSGSSVASWLPVVSLRRTTASSDVGNITWADVDWEASEQEDWESWESVTNPERVVLDEAGAYIVIAQSVWETSAAGSRYARVLRNGNTANEVLEWGDSAAEGSALFRHNTTGVVIAAANDYLSLQVYQNSGGNLGLLGGAVDREATRLWIVKLKA